MKNKQLTIASQLPEQPENGLLKMTSKNPDKSIIKTNAQAGGKKYLPIAFVEQQLDIIFQGCWNIEDFRWEVVANEIVGSLVLVCKHPTDTWVIKRTGVGAVMIQQSKGAAIDDIGSKVKNTLVKDFPHLKSECLKNAAKSLGNLFGRDLNREIEDNYVQAVMTFEQRIDVCDNLTDLKSLYNSLPAYAREELAPRFTIKREELENA